MLNEHGIILPPFCFSLGLFINGSASIPGRVFLLLPAGVFLYPEPTAENRKKPQKTPSMPLTFTPDLGILNAHDAG